jgi:hypothetical protein
MYLPRSRFAFGFCRGHAFIGIAFRRAYLGWQYNIPCWRLLWRCRWLTGSGFHIWLGPLYVQYYPRPAIVETHWAGQPQG